MDNIELLLEGGVGVQVRLNMDDANCEDLKTLAGQLAQRFGKHEKFSVYPFLLFQDILSPSEVRKAQLFDKYRSFRGELEQLGLIRSGKLPATLRLNRCMADDPASVVILPDGRLCACEHFNETPGFGSLDSACSKDLEAGYWQETYPEDPFCGNCPLYPDCFRLKNCPDTSEHCIPGQREAEIEKLRAGMRAAFASKK